MLIFNPQTASDIYAQASSTVLLTALFHEATRSRITLCPAFFSSFDEARMYRAFPGTWAIFQVSDLQDNPVITCGLVFSHPVDGFVRAYVVPLVRGKPKPMSLRSLQVNLHCRPSAVIVQGSDTKVCCTISNTQRHFRYGLEVVQVHMKQLGVPAITPPQREVNLIRNALLSNDLDLWALARKDLQRYDRIRAKIGYTQRIIHSNYAGGIAEVIGRGQKRGDIRVKVFIGGRTLGGYIPLSYLGLGFQCGDQVQWETTSERYMSGWIVGKVDETHYFVQQCNSVRNINNSGGLHG